MTAPASAMLSSIDEQTGIKYSCVFSPGLGHSPTLAFINKGFAELVRTILSVSSLVVALPQSKFGRLPCVLLFTEHKDRCPDCQSDGGKPQHIVYYAKAYLRPGPLVRLSFTTSLEPCIDHGSDGLSPHIEPNNT